MLGLDGQHGVSWPLSEHVPGQHTCNESLIVLSNKTTEHLGRWQSNGATQLKTLNCSGLLWPDIVHVWGATVGLADQCYLSWECSGNWLWPSAGKCMSIPTTPGWISWAADSLGPGKLSAHPDRMSKISWSICMIHIVDHSHRAWHCCQDTTFWSAGNLMSIRQRVQWNSPPLKSYTKLCVFRGISSHEAKNMYSLLHTEKGLPPPESKTNFREALTGKVSTLYHRSMYLLQITTLFTSGPSFNYSKWPPRFFSPNPYLPPGMISSIDHCMLGLLSARMTLVHTGNLVVKK